MKRMYAFSLACVAEIFVAQALFAQYDATQACIAIYKNSTRDTSASKQDNVELARTFSSFCERDGSVNSSATSVGLDAIVYSIPVSFAFTGSSNEQKLTEFCKKGATQYDSWNSGSLNTSTVVTAALDSFNACVALARTGLHLSVAITQPDTLTVGGAADASYAGYLTSVAYDQQYMDCVSADFTPHHTSASYHGAVHLPAKNTFSLTCTKKKQTSPDGKSTFYPRTNLTIAAGSVAPLSIVFPSDTLNGYELASQSRIAVDKAVSELDVTKSEASALKQKAEALQGALNGVRVYTRLWGEGSAFGCYNDFTAAYQAQIQSTCPTGTNRVIDVMEGGVSGKACGYSAHAYACVPVPKP